MPEPVFRDAFDNLLEKIGMGRWQVLGIIGNIIVWGLYGSHTVGSTFWNPPVEFYCCSELSSFGHKMEDGAANRSNVSISNLGDSVFDSQCLTTLSSDNSSVSEETFCIGDFRDEQEVAGNSAYSENVKFFKTTNLESCPLVVYDTSVFSSSIMTEWNLICDRSEYSSFFLDFLTVGMILGCATAGEIGDRLGRVRTLIFSSILHGIGCTVVAVTTNFTLLIVGRFLTGLTLFQALIAVHTWTVETCPMRYRGLVGSLVAFPYGLIVTVMSGLAYYIRDWRPLYIAINWPALLLLPLAWFMDESPRWLLRKGLIWKATEIMWKAASLNKSELESRNYVEEELKKVMAEDKRGMETRTRNHVPCWKVVSSTKMMQILIGMPVVNFLSKLLCYVIIFGGNTFAGSNVFLYVAITGIFESLSVATASKTVDIMGRKMAMIKPAFISALLMLMIVFVSEDLIWLQWVLIFTSLFAIACCNQATYVYVSELFPTVIRARGVGLTNLFGNLGILAAPFLPNVLANYGSWVVPTIMSVSSILIVLILLEIPETKGVPMCETIEDVEQRAVNAKGENRRLTPRRSRNFFSICLKRNGENVDENSELVTHVRGQC